MSEQAIPDQIRSLGRYYEHSQQGNLILRAGWLMEVAERAERILERVDEELQQVRAEMEREDAEADRQVPRGAWTAEQESRKAARR